MKCRFSDERHDVRFCLTHPGGQINEDAFSEAVENEADPVCMIIGDPVPIDIWREALQRYPDVWAPEFEAFCRGAFFERYKDVHRK